MNAANLTESLSLNFVPSFLNGTLIVSGKNGIGNNNSKLAKYDDGANITDVNGKVIDLSNIMDVNIMDIVNTVSEEQTPIDTEREAEEKGVKFTGIWNLKERKS